MTDAEKTLLEMIEDLYDQFENGTIPNIRLSTRTKKNIEYSEESEVWVYGNQTSLRSAKTVKGAYHLLKMAYSIELLIKEHLRQDRGSTLRELYYISENWDKKGDLNAYVKKEIKNKHGADYVVEKSLGTTPRRLTDLLGSLCDLTSGSGDKGTPVIHIQGYFDDYTVE